MSDARDHAAQQRLDEEGIPTPFDGVGALDPTDELALYALVYSALAEEVEGETSQASITAIEARIDALETVRLHPLEWLAAGLALAVTLPAAPAAFSSIDTAARVALDASVVTPLLAALAAAATTVALDLLLRRSRSSS